MPSNSPRRRWLLVAGLLIVCLWAGLTAGVAAQPPPAESLAAAVAALERDGYVARFAVAGGRSGRGEVRYQSSAAYALRFEEEGGAEVEYVLLDPDLYTRLRRAGDGWGPWERRTWHPDVPVPDLAALHPRLPLELLRAAQDLRDAPSSGAGAPNRRMLQGNVSFTAAFFASYEDTPADPEQRSAAQAARSPLSIQIDAAAGRVLEMALAIGADGGDAPTTLAYAFIDTRPALSAPAGAVERESTLAVRPAPDQPAAALPFTVRGRGGTVLSPPFVVRGGAAIARLDPGLSDSEWRIWRIKRGRQLIAGFGAASGEDGPLTFPIAVAPGEYVLEIVLPDDVGWTLTIEQPPAGAVEGSAER